MAALNLNIAHNQRNTTVQPGVAPTMTGAPVNPANPTNQANTANPPANTPANPVVNPPAPTHVTKEDWMNVLKAVVISTLSFWITFLILYSLAPNWYFWPIVCFALIVSVLVLIAVDSIIDSKSKLGGAIVIFIILQAFVLTFSHYANNSNVNKGITKTEARSETSAEIITSTKVYDLKAGEETPWLGTAQDKITNLTWASPDYDFDVISSDERNHWYPGNASLPPKNHCFFKIKARSDQMITVTANEQN